MTKDEIKTAVVRVAVMKLEQPTANLAELAKNYLEQMTPNWSLGELFFIHMNAEKLANDDRFKAKVKITREEFIDQDSGEVVTITRTEILK